MTRQIRGLFLFIVLCFWARVNAQVPSYNISTSIQTDCRAKFYDDGGPTANYNCIAGGTTYTFQIITGNPIITMTFNPSGSATQIFIQDVLTIYDKFPLIPANIIGGPFTNIPVTGTISPVTSTTGSMIVVWSADGSGCGFGWDAGWYSHAPAPAPPTASINPIPSCNASVISFTTTGGILCSSLTANFFSITGPVNPVISTIIPTPCNSGTTTSFDIHLAPPGLNKNCNYSINATLFRKDKCDSVYQFPNIINTFSIGNCPIQGSLNVTATNTVCAYSCTASVSAVVPASVCLNLTYNWDNGLPPNPGPHAVCPIVTTVYNCTVTEQTTLTQTILTQTITVIDPQIAPLPSYTICTSNPSFNFTATPAGGTWIGSGITNTATGTFCPGCVSAGVKTVTYQVGNCQATIQFTTVLASAGSDDAACLNGPTFTVSGGSPAGGVWSGAGNITPTGVFTPTLVGNYLVTYSVGSCSSNKTIHVTNAVTVPSTVIPICRSNWFTWLYLRPDILPFGGRYSGSTGITNSVYGQFTPSLAPLGLNVITYSLNGCSSTFTINVLDIDVTPSTATTCPNHTPFLLSTFPVTASPAGGTWTCSNAGSIQNASTGLYDPSASGIISHTDILVYTAPNGCPDTVMMKALRTNIDQDTVFFCTNSNTLQLSNNLVSFSYSPTGGVYSGPGVSLIGPDYIFNPTTAGQGIHTVYYDINGCNKDSVKMIVYPDVVTVADQTLCSSHPTISLVTPPLPFGTNWGGAPGIISASLGIMNPSVVLAGATPPGNLYTYTFTNRASCGTGSANIYVYQFVAANITNLASAYCYQNTSYTFNTVPPNGTLTAVSTITPNTFNPSMIGAGQYTVTYEFGVGACNTSTSLVVKVWPQLTTTTSISAPTICVGESSKLNVKGFGGLPTVTQYTYSWSNGLIPINSQNVVPNSTTVYTCVTSDGCSDPVIDTFRILVHPNYYTSFATPSIQCYGVAAQVTTNITPTGPYSYTWNTTPVQTTSVLSGFAGKNYFLKIKNTSTGCSKDTSIVIPGWPAIKALFSPEPNLNCVPLEQSNISFLDLSNGATSGTWIFNGATQSYTPGATVSHDFVNPGSYNVTLNVVNQGNCPSTYALSVCVLESTEIFLPDIFSPNKDGANDVLYLRGNGIKEMTFQIYDRWGNKVFESNDAKSGWDGTYKGKDAEPGVYAYYLNVTLYTDKKITQKGDVTLVR